MANLLKQSTAVVKSFGPFLDKTDGVTPETGLVSALDHASTGIVLSKNGGAFAVRAATVTATTYDAYGNYRVSLKTTDTDTLGSLRMQFIETSTCLPVWMDFMVLPATVYDALVTNATTAVGGLGDVQRVAGTAQTARDLGQGIPNAVAGAAGGLLIAGSNAATTFGTLTVTGAVTFQSTFAVTTSTALGALSGSSVTFSGAVALQSTLTVTGATTFTGAVTASNAANDIAGIRVATGGITAASIADNAIDRATFAADTGLQTIRSNTAQAGAATTITLDASASAVDDFYKNALVFLTGGTGVGQSRTVSGYVGATKVATITPNWGTNPDNTTTFAVLPAGAVAGASAPTAGEVADAVWDEARSGHVSAGTFGEYVPADATRISGDATAADNLELFFDGTGYNAANSTVGAVALVATTTNLTNLPTIPANWLTAAGTAADFGTEIGTAVRAEMATELARIDAAVTTRMATYTQPTGFLAATFSGTVASTTNITAGTITTVGTLTTYTGNTPQTGDAFARLGAPAGASVSADVAAVKTDTGNLVTRITSALFSGITSFASWLGAIAGKTADAGTQTEIRATTAGAGYTVTTDSLEAIRDYTGTGTSTLDAAGVRAAVGLVSANLDTQLDAIPTAAENATATRSELTVELARIDATVSSRGTSTLTQTQVSGGAYAINGASFAFNAALDFTTTQKAATLARVTLVDTATTLANAPSDSAGTTTLLSRISADRAGYLDNLNVSGAVASQADINALNQSASRRVILTTVNQYERPESGSSTFQIEARTYDGDGAAVNADTTPTLAATGFPSGTNLSANLSAATNPATGVYRWTYTVPSVAVLEQVAFDLSATIAASAFPMRVYSQVVDYTSANWTATNASNLTAIFNKLPTNNIADQTLLNAAIDALPTNAELATALDPIPTAAENATAARSELATELVRIDAAVTTRATPAQVNAEVLDVLNVDTFVQPTGVPTATDTLAAKIGRVHQALISELTVTATALTFFSHGGAALWKKGVSDSGIEYAETDGAAP